VGRSICPGSLFAPPNSPLPGREGRVEGMFGAEGRVVGIFGVAGRVDGRSGVAGRVEGLSPPDGRSTEGIAGFVDGRLIFGELMLGRLVGAGRLLPMFGTLECGAGRDSPPPPPPPIDRPPPPPPPMDRPPPPPPPPRRP
jgi:hypothetical protein